MWWATTWKSVNHIPKTISEHFSICITINTLGRKLNWAVLSIAMAAGKFPTTLISKLYLLVLFISSHRATFSNLATIGHCIINWNFWYSTNRKEGIRNGRDRRQLTFYTTMSLYIQIMRRSKLLLWTAVTWLVIILTVVLSRKAVNYYCLCQSGVLKMCQDDNTHDFLLT